MDNKQETTDPKMLLGAAMCLVGDIMYRDDALEWMRLFNELLPRHYGTMTPDQVRDAIKTGNAFRRTLKDHGFSPEADPKQGFMPAI